MTHEEELNKAAEMYDSAHTYQRYDGGGYTPEYDATLADAFKAGVEWAFGQGETFVASIDYDDGYFIDTTDQEQEVIDKLGLKVMDKVIVQIRKK